MANKVMIRAWVGDFAGEWRRPNEIVSVMRRGTVLKIKAKHAEVGDLTARSKDENGIIELHAVTRIETTRQSPSMDASDRRVGAA